MWNKIFWHRRHIQFWEFIKEWKKTIYYKVISQIPVIVEKPCFYPFTLRLKRVRTIARSCRRHSSGFVGKCEGVWVHAYYGGKYKRMRVVPWHWLGHIESIDHELPSTLYRERLIAFRFLVSRLHIPDTVAWSLSF